MPSITCHLVHFNLAIAREALDHPCMAGFVEQLEPLNQLARASRGFLWAPEGDEAGNATAVFGNERALPNLSVWQSLEDLRRFVYEGLHAGALNRRTEWFEAARGPAYVLWWTPIGDRPDFAEAKRRLEHLSLHGPTPDAFTFGEAFDPLESNARGTVHSEVVNGADGGNG
jgi:uncharacterized protein DUF3291